jgi:hypothetical protein
MGRIVIRSWGMMGGLGGSLGSLGEYVKCIEKVRG